MFLRPDQVLLLGQPDTFKTSFLLLAAAGSPKGATFSSNLKTGRAVQNVKKEKPGLSLTYTAGQSQRRAGVNVELFWRVP